MVYSFRREKTNHIGTNKSYLYDKVNINDFPEKDNQSFHHLNTEDNQVKDEEYHVFRSFSDKNDIDGKTVKIVQDNNLTNWIIPDRDRNVKLGSMLAKIGEEFDKKDTNNPRSVKLGSMLAKIGWDEDSCPKKSPDTFREIKFP